MRAALGDFELRREVGRGGMGTVYEAWERSLQRVVALKVLSSHVSASPKAIVRFQREAQAAAKLHHTHIVPIFAQGEADGIYFYAMEFVSGESLHQMISRLRGPRQDEFAGADLAETVVLHRDETTKETPSSIARRAEVEAERKEYARLPVVPFPEYGTGEFFRRVAETMAAVADALDYAHSQGVIHRDIKPHNLILGTDNRMRVMDFGLARLQEQPGVTITGEMVGSPLYMSPEQIRGGAGKVDQRTDIYSLGATLYEWLTLHPPYPGETREAVIGMILGSVPPTPRALNPSIPIDLETITLKAIEREPGRRYATAGRMRDDLRLFLADRPIIARRTGRLRRAARFIARHPATSVAAAAVVMALGLLWAVRVNQKRAAVEKEAAIQATAAADKVQESNEQLLAFFAMMQRGPANLADATFPAMSNIVGADPGPEPDVAERAESDQAAVGSIDAIAHRSAGEFYASVVPRRWLDEPTLGDDESRQHLHEAVRRLNSDDAGGAASLLDSYLATNPGDFEAWQLRVLLHGRQRQYDAMLQTAGELVRLADSMPRAKLWSGLALLLLNRPEPSYEALTAAMTGRTELVWARALRGLASLKRGQPDDALRDFNNVLRGAPWHVPALLGKTLAHMASQQYEDAVQAATEVLTIEAGNADALTLRGDARSAAGVLEDAASDFQAAMDIAGRTPALLLRWGNVQFRLYQERSMATKGIGADQPTSEATKAPDSEPKDGPDQGTFEQLLRKVAPWAKGVIPPPAPTGGPGG